MLTDAEANHSPRSTTTPPPNEDWLNVEELTEVAITSEDPAQPNESALLPGEVSGWRAAGLESRRSGVYSPIRNGCGGSGLASWSPVLSAPKSIFCAGGQAFREIVRQQWNFSPLGAASETDDYHIELPGVPVHELNIIPDIGGDRHLLLWNRYG
jgi:hypothetical protein